MSSFQADYHVPVYQKIMSMLRSEDPDADMSPFEEVISGGRHETTRLYCDKTPLENLAEKRLEAFDITLSNAVFEHLYHPLKALSSLRRVTRKGGMGFHQVDFRDHRDFSRPLEYLLLDELTFLEIMEEQHYKCGNRIRPDEMEALFRYVGFGEVEFFPNMWARSEYLLDLVPRLRAARFSPYADISVDRLQVISGRFVVSNGMDAPVCSSG
ncbi:MAG: methyltransferase domain-containing protein [Micrococcales bacterium]|nr:methyltransferase domain-containing protein [Micrococcales bacterium]